MEVSRTRGKKDYPASRDLGNFIAVIEERDTPIPKRTQAPKLRCDLPHERALMAK
jgi:hypothetical protein